MKKTRVILALFLALLALGGLFMAVAGEGQGSMDVSPGDDEPPAVTDPTDPPVTDPTDPPVTDPTDTPSTDPTDEPGPTDTPTDEPGPTDEPTADPSGDPSAEPSAEPTEEPTPEPPVNNNTGGGNSGGDQGPATRPGSNAGGGIRQPSASSRRPTGSSSLGGSAPAAGDSGQAPAEDGPQYVTFARVTQKSNSMARTLFYSGAVCIGTGALGLGVLAVFMVRGRRADGREELIAEIEQASVRRPIRPAPRGGYEDEVYEEEPGRPNVQRRAQAGPAPSLHRPEPEELSVPVNGSLYTEEFELPPQQAADRPPYQAPRAPEPIVPAEVSMYTEEFEPPRPVYTGRSVPRPRRDSVYPEEISLSDEMARPAAPRQVRRQPEVRPRPRPASQVPPDQMDTSELLREILHGDEK